MMNNLVLYRKYRPKTFEEVLGQDHIVAILESAIKSKRVSHAYLFAGARGTGKTSVARILAKEIGCVDIDLIEIDAASSRGIDEIRALREAVHYAPLQGPVKVYIIDEVHMLTKEAFNALLKTLEEPPKHVVFVLATTELEKVPDTIISRCQNFSFRKIPESILLSSVISIAKKEGFEIDYEAAGLIALASDGSFRDSQGMLDQILSLGDKNKDKKISGKEVREFLAVPRREMVENFILAVLEKKADEGLKIIEQVINENMDIRMFLKLILRDVRSMLLLRLAPMMKKQLEETLGDREFKFTEKNANLPKGGELEKILKILLESYEVRTRSYLPQLPLELAFLRIVNPILPGRDSNPD
ncbi:MAG: DNA polymerase III subunit gamma/tau [Candidatus Parcubacteria bacterium]|nr:DNA polymerase III subunit gamma/tau [Candidatus Parcubacteria bacterium]